MSGELRERYVSELEAEVKALKKQVARLTLDKENMKLRNRMLRRRLDLPLQRIHDYDKIVAEWDRLIAEAAKKGESGG